jgi:hypothetical protein
MEMGVERGIYTSQNGQEISLYCRICYEELSREFYDWNGKHALIEVHDCEHYVWVFLRDAILTPPWDEETKEIIDHAFAKVDTSNGKYFLLPRDLAGRYS